MRVKFTASLLAADGESCVWRHEEREFGDKTPELYIQQTYDMWVHEQCAQGWYVIDESETKQGDDK
jgi:hypothetical protein